MLHKQPFRYSVKKTFSFYTPSIYNINDGLQTFRLVGARPRVHVALNFPFKQPVVEFKTTHSIDITDIALLNNMFHYGKSSKTRRIYSDIITNLRFERDSVMEQTQIIYWHRSDFRKRSKTVLNINADGEMNQHECIEIF